MRKDRNNRHDGGSLDDFLKQEGIYEEVRLNVLKETLANKLRQAMEAQDVTKAQMARRMGTSRSSLDRLLAVDHNVTLGTMGKAAAVLGKSLRIDLVDRETVNHEARG